MSIWSSFCTFDAVYTVEEGWGEGESVPIEDSFLDVASSSYYRGTGLRIIFELNPPAGVLTDRCVLDRAQVTQLRDALTRWLNAYPEEAK